MDRLIDSIVTKLSDGITAATSTREQRIVRTVLFTVSLLKDLRIPLQRLRQSKGALLALVKEELGDRFKELVIVNALATDPYYQGHGYGTPLMNMATNLVRDQLIADHDRQAVLIRTTSRLIHTTVP